MWKMVHHLKRTRARRVTDRQTVLKLPAEFCLFKCQWVTKSKSPKIKLLEMKLPVEDDRKGDLRFCTHSSTTHCSNIAQSSSNWATKRTAKCRCTKNKICRNRIQKLSRLNQSYYKSQTHNPERSHSGVSHVQRSLVGSEWAVRRC